MSTRVSTRVLRERKLIQRLMELSQDPKLKRSLRKHGLSIPMSEILKKVPGVSVAEKARALGVNRATWYVWMKGSSRPNLEKAKKLSEWTNYSIAEIRGVESELCD